MKPTTLLTAAALVVALAAPAFAQRTGGHTRGGGGGGSTSRAGAPATGHAVPRGSVHPGPGPGGPHYPGRPSPYYGGYRPYYGYPYYGYGYGYGYPHYYSSFSFGFGFGYPFGFAYGYGYPYGYPYGYGYGYGYGPYNGGYVAVAPGQPYGGVRLDLAERDAQVLVDGYYVGIVDNYDGALQQLNLEPGTHRIEIQLDGYAPAAFNVNVAPGRTVTYRTPLRPAP